jgi:hypothetical protein
MSVLKLSLLIDLQQKAGELVFSITYCTSIITLEKCFILVYRKNVVMVTLTNGMFPLFTFMRFWMWDILRKWSACAPTTCEVVRDSQKF